MEHETETDLHIHIQEFMIKGSCSAGALMDTSKILEAIPTMYEESWTITLVNV